VQKFDEFINTIIGDLKISNRKKNELIDEFKDHLVMLRNEFIEKGLSEDEAINSAIENFGDPKELNKKLSDSLLSYRSVPNALLGVIIYLLIFRICSHIPIPYSEPDNYFKIIMFGTLGSTILFLPIGYFLPILFSRIHQVKNALLISIVPGLLVGLYVSFAVKEFIPINELFIIIYILGSIFGSTIGYYSLVCVNKLVWLSKGRSRLKI
jgi:hypothetical protein